MFFHQHWPEILIMVAMSVTFALYVVRYAAVAMKLWQDFLDSINTDGGHLFLLGLFVMVCCMHIAPSLEKYEGELIGALLMALKAAGSNKARRDMPAPPTVTDVAVSTVSSQPAPTDSNSKDNTIA